MRLDEVDALVANLWASDPRRAAELDSLKALAFMLQNSDTKPDNQRLVAIRDEGDEEPAVVVMLQDIGATFGRGKDRISRVVSKLDFRRWRQRMRKPWVVDERLVLRLPRGMHAEGGWKNPEISEEGLRFFLERAARLGEDELVEIFEQARFPEATGRGGA